MFLGDLGPAVDAMHFDAKRCDAHMGKRLAGLIAATSVFAVALAMASSAMATPSRSGQCGGCHNPNSAIVVTATQTSNNGMNATYNVGVSNPYADGVTGWGVFNGSTKVAGALGAGAFTVAVGKTYTVWGVAGTKGRGTKSITISPAAPPPVNNTGDTTPPAVTLTTPTNGAAVSGSVLLSATAADTGTGMSRVEFRVDGTLVGTAYPPTFTVVWNASSASPGSHVIQARAIDVAGNASTSSISVSIAAAAPPPPATGTFTDDFSAGQVLDTARLETSALGGGAATVGGNMLTLSSPAASSSSVLSFRNAVPKTSASSYSVRFRVTDIADGSALGLLSMHAGPSRVTSGPTRYLDASYVRVGITQGLQLTKVGPDGVTLYYNWANATWSTTAGKFSLQPNTVYIVKFETNASGQFHYVVCSQAGTPLVNGTSIWTSFSAVYNDVADNYWPYLGDAFTNAYSGTMEILGVRGPAPATTTPSDTTPPTVTLTSPANGATVAGSVAIAASASDAGSGVSRVEFRVDGMLLATDSASPYSTTWSASSASAGAHTIQATAVDGAGNSASASIQANIAAPPDTTSPSVALTSPAAGGTVTGSVVLAATASDAGSGVSRVEFRVDGTLVASDASSPYSATWNSSSAGVGAHTVQVTAFDVAGNSASTSVSVNVPAPPPPADTTPPSVSITSPTSGATVTGATALAATASDAGSGVARIEFRVDGVLVGSDANSPYSSSWDASSVASGAHTIRATAIDVAGNSTSASISVNVPAPPPPVDTTAPTVAITSPANGSTISGAITIAASGTDSGSGMSRVEFRVDGALLFTDTAAPYSTTWDPSSSPAGLHTITARAYDLAGNASTSSISVSIAAAAPPPPATGTFTDDFSAGQVLDTARLETSALGGGAATVGGNMLTLSSPAASSSSVLSFRNAVPKTSASSYSVRFRVTDIADGSALGLLSMHAGPSRVTSGPTRYLDASYVRVGITQGLQLTKVGPDGATLYYNWANATWSATAGKFSLQPNTVYIVKFETNASGQFHYVVCSQAGTPLVNGTSIWTSFSAVYNDVADNYWPYLGDAFTNAYSGTMEILGVSGR